jgi:hypothetical protein
VLVVLLVAWWLWLLLTAQEELQQAAWQLLAQKIPDAPGGCEWLVVCCFTFAFLFEDRIVSVCVLGWM